MSEMSKENQEKVSQLQLIEQNIQQTNAQKQQFQMQLMEINSAIEELGKTDKAYKIVGNIMVASEKADLEAQLKENKKIVELRIKTFENQENKLKERAEKIRKEILSNIQN